MITILPKHFPNMASHSPQDECGISIYRGVIIQWDEDHDDRVVLLIDLMPSKMIDHLQIVQEHEGTVSFVWDKYAPDGYESGQQIDIDGDTWTIESTVIFSNKWR